MKPRPSVAFCTSRAHPYKMALVKIVYKTLLKSARRLDALSTPGAELGRFALPAPAGGGAAAAPPPSLVSALRSAFKAGAAAAPGAASGRLVDLALAALPVVRGALAGGAPRSTRTGPVRAFCASSVLPPRITARRPLHRRASRPFAAPPRSAPAPPPLRLRQANKRIAALEAAAREPQPDAAVSATPAPLAATPRFSVGQVFRHARYGYR